MYIKISQTSITIATTKLKNPTKTSSENIIKFLSEESTHEPIDTQRNTGYNLECK